MGTTKGYVMSKNKNMKSICLMIREDQYQKLQDSGVNMSGYIRDLIDDSLSEYVITLNVSEETRKLYDRVISMSSEGDTELEPYLRTSLKNLLDINIKEMQKLQKKLAGAK